MIGAGRFDGYCLQLVFTSAQKSDYFRLLAVILFLRIVFLLLFPHYYMSPPPPPECGE